MADLEFLGDDWPAISARLDEALALEPAQRLAWLQSLAETAAVKDKLRRLLGNPVGVETAELLDTLPRFNIAPHDTPPGSAGDTPQPTDAAHGGARVGPYRLIRELGVGGMGLVWLAERTDGGMKRQVALKLPRVGWSHGFAERLRRERDILASLDHPNIARIYDAGVDDQGRPYLALEFVEGTQIDQYCKAQALPVRERLGLLLQVARAVAHAHARLVVHRDLKPANILVTAQGQVRLLDFGIAKLMEGELTCETQLTQQAGRALTLDYASPEQIRGEPIGTASDVYSLGVVAYELLAEARPYRLKRRSAAALEEAIASIDVPAPSSAAASPGAARALKGDLDAILNKALKKNVAERYPSIDALAQDIERHLANLPVQARPDALGYRLRKFLRRNQLAVAAAAAIGLSLIGGASLAAWPAREALAQADRAERVKEFTLSIFDDADATSQAGTSKTAADLLRSARARVNNELGGNPELAVELMTAIGMSMVGHGLSVDAETLLREAVAVSSRQLGAQHALTCAAQVVHGEALVELGRNPEAIATLSPCIESARRVGDLHALNAGLRWLSTAQFNDGRIDEGVVAAQQAVETLSARRGRGKPLTPRDAMLSHQAYADALGQADRPGAVAAAQRALGAAQQIYGTTVVPSVLDIRTMLALAMVTEGQLKEGLRELDALVPATEGLLGPRHPRVSKIAHLVGNAKLSAGDVPGAIVAYQRSMAVEDLVQGASSSFDRGMARFFLGSAYAAARRPDAAVPLLDESRALLHAAVGADNPRTLRAASAHAWQLAEAGRLVAAQAGFDTLESAAWSATDLAGHQRRLAALRSLQGRHEDALVLAESANRTLKTIGNKNIQARALALLGTVRLDAGDAASALLPLQQAKALFTQVQAGASPDLAETWVALGRAQLSLGDVTAAVQSLTDAQRFWQGFDASNRHAGLAKLHLARARWAQGDKREAAEALRDAGALLAAGVFATDRALLQSARRQQAL